MWDAMLRLHVLYLRSAEAGRGKVGRLGGVGMDSANNQLLSL